MTSAYLYDIQTRGNRPIYEFLYEQIRNDILKGKIKTGEQLPSKRALAQQLNISVATIEKTYHELSLEGYIAPRQRRGFFVEPLAKTTPLHANSGQINWLILTIRKKTSRRLIFKPITRELRSSLLLLGLNFYERLSRKTRPTCLLLFLIRACLNSVKHLPIIYNAHTEWPFRLLKLLLEREQNISTAELCSFFLQTPSSFSKTLDIKN